MRSHTHSTDEGRPNHRPTTLKEQLLLVDKSLHWVIRDMTLPLDEGAEIAENIVTGNGKCMSDGSLKDDFGTAAYVPLRTAEENRYIGRTDVPGEDDEQSSYRSELCGILGNIIVYNAICILHGIDEPCEIEVGCDNETALWNSFGDNDVCTKMASADIVAAIRAQMTMSTLRWKPKWVKGHQDDKKKASTTANLTKTDPPTPLDEWAIANIECDKHAEEKWIQSTNEGQVRPEVGVLKGETWSLWIGGRKRSSNLDDALYIHAKGDDIIHYWAKTKRMSPGTAELIDWKGHRAAMKAFRDRQIWLAKHFSGWGGSGVMMHRRKERDTSACHKCGEKETTIHVVQCQHADNKATYATSRKILKTWLTKTTSLAIVKAVLCHMDAYQEGKQVVDVGEFDSTLRIAAMYQATIGPRSFGEGLLSTQWQLAQKAHFLQKGGHETSKRWVSKLIQHLWEISWQMWDKRNDEIHSSAEVRRSLYSGGILAKIQSLKMQADFSLCLSREEINFFQTPLETISRKRERSQLDWISRAEQFLNSSRLSMRLKNSRGAMYRWLSGGDAVRRRTQNLITDHMRPQNTNTNDTLETDNNENNDNNHKRKKRRLETTQD